MDKKLKVALISFGIGIILLILFLVLPWEQPILGIKVVFLIAMIVCFFITVYLVLEKLGVVEALDDLIS
ncbi:MAG: hypothetical protein ACXABO_16450 [Promethearchaeota archaeon]|jgi:hypothetical protein